MHIIKLFNYFFLFYCHSKDFESNVHLVICHCFYRWLLGRTDFRHGQLGRTLNWIRPVLPQMDESCVCKVVLVKSEKGKLQPWNGYFNLITNCGHRWEKNAVSSVQSTFSQPHRIGNNDNNGIWSFTLFKQKNPATKCYSREYWAWDLSHSGLILSSLSYWGMCYLGFS